MEKNRKKGRASLEAAKAFLSTVGRHAASQAVANVREFARYTALYGREHLRRFTGSVREAPHEVQQSAQRFAEGVKRRRIKVNL